MESFPSVGRKHDPVAHETNGARWRNNRNVGDTEIEELKHCSAIARRETRCVPGVGRLQRAL